MTDKLPRSLARRIHGAVVWLLPGLVIVAGALGLAAVVDAGIPDWYMHLGMWGALTVYLLIYLASFFRRRRIRQWINLLIFLGVSAFWSVVLRSLVPAQTLAVRGELVERAALPVLWAPIALLAAACVLLVAHAVVLGRWHREGDG